MTRALLQNEEALEKLRLLAERGLPALWIPVTSGGTTGPVTTRRQRSPSTTPGVLAGIVLSQLAREGAPIIVPGFGGDALDLRTTVDPYAEPDHRGVAAALAHCCGLPMFSLAGGSDAKTARSAGGRRGGASRSSSTGCRAATSSTTAGYLESGLTGSLVQLAICDEIIAWVRRAVAPVEVSDETLALDLVDELGVDGSFLESDHTLDHYRERWYPDLFERFSHAGWKSRGGLTLAERAAARVDELLAAHAPPPARPGHRPRDPGRRGAGPGGRRALTCAIRDARTGARPRSTRRLRPFPVPARGPGAPSRCSPAHTPEAWRSR